MDEGHELRNRHIPFALQPENFVRFARLNRAPLALRCPKPPIVCLANVYNTFHYAGDSTRIMINVMRRE